MTNNYIVVWTNKSIYHESRWNRHQVGRRAPGTTMELAMPTFGMSAFAIVPFAPVTYASPGGLFKVTFTADFGVRVGPDAVAVHLWNTATPTLSPRMVYAALSLFAPLYASIDNPPDDVAVLSLREPRLYRLSEAGRFASLGSSLVGRVEETLRDVRDELGLPGPEDQPGAPR